MKAKEKAQLRKDITAIMETPTLTLSQFISIFVEHNTLIRLWYKAENGKDGQHVEVIEGDKPMMEHELTKSVYKNTNVIGVTDILYYKSPYLEAVNIVIERP